ncbi:sulfite exporter TauE/SafE family protein [Cellvibrio sp. KY-GH-1]|nr:sulfite exporter TauE/SafE family protein [Cellvibrio sp. KY-GH-1]QEY17579.1 sulfite exporter TauE/SafE family protein [Cellvibrio sp. KY-GH-1]
MSDLTLTQLVLVCLIFVWSGFVRTGLGFGGAMMSLPLLLLVDNGPLVYLPIVAVHLLVFSTLTVWQNNRKRDSSDVKPSTVDWAYIKKSMKIMIVPKLIGVAGLLTIPAHIMSAIIFVIISIYSVTYILNKPFKSSHPVSDGIFLSLGAYISGTSLIGAPLIMTVYMVHVAREKLRDTLFVLWFILVSIKMVAFLIAGVDLQLQAHLWLLPATALGHYFGLKFHARLIKADPVVFYRVIGSALLLVSGFGLVSLYW